MKLVRGKSQTRWAIPMRIVIYPSTKADDRRTPDVDLFLSWSLQGLQIFQTDPLPEPLLSVAVRARDVVPHWLQ